MKNDFCALSTKIKAMHSGFLTEKDYEAMLEKHTVGEINAYLKQTYYAPFVSGMNDGSVHRGTLEEHVERKYGSDYQKLYKFVGHKERKILNILFMRFEISILKIALGRIFGRERAVPGDIKNMTGGFFAEHSDIDTELLSESRTVADVGAACAGTCYRQIIDRAQSLNCDYPVICMMLDKLFFKKLWSAAKKNDLREEALVKYVGMLIDYHNIMWIYRLKKYFKTPSELIYTYLIPVYYGLSSEEISAIAEADGTENLERLIRRTKYADILDDDNSFIEHNYKKIYCTLAKKAYRLYPETITQVFAYFGLLLTEEENIKTIIEGIRYGISPELIRKYIYIG